MASVARRPLPEQPFSIHEDAATDEVDMADDDPEQRTEEVRAPSEDAVAESEDGSAAEESSEDEAPAPNVARDMEKLGREVPGIKGKYRLIKRIGEGELSPGCGRTATRVLAIHGEQQANRRGRR